MSKDHNKIYLEELAERDERIFSNIYDQYWEPLFKYVIRILPDENETADILQETFIVLWGLRDQWGKINSMKAYLFMIARNKAFKKFQSKLKQQRYLESLTNFYSEADEYDEQQISTRDLEKIINAEIEKLPDKMKQIFIMSRKENLSYKEIAEKLKISDLTVKKQISNSLKQLRSKIGDEFIPYIVLLLAGRFF